MSVQLQAQAALSLREKPPAPHRVIGWAGHRAGLGILEKRKISCMCWKSNAPVTTTVTSTAAAAAAATTTTTSATTSNNNNNVEFFF